MKLSYLYVPVADLTSAAAFYRDELGLEEAWRDGDTTVAFSLPDSAVQIMVAVTKEPAGPMHEVPDLSAWLAEHNAIPVVVERYPIPGGSVAGFRDTDGNAFYVFDQIDAQG